MRPRHLLPVGALWVVLRLLGNAPLECRLASSCADGRATGAAGERARRRCPRESHGAGQMFSVALLANSGLAQITSHGRYAVFPKCDSICSRRYAVFPKCDSICSFIDTGQKGTAMRRDIYNLYVASSLPCSANPGLSNRWVADSAQRDFVQASWK